MEIKIIKTFSPEKDVDKGEEKKRRTGGWIESPSPNIVIIILNRHKVELHSQGRDSQIG